MKFKTLILAITALLFFEAGSYGQVKTVFDRWDKTDKLIMGRKIDRDAAIDSIIMYVPMAVQEFKTLDIHTTKRGVWAFPMSGWTGIIYRSGGNDYKDSRFDYFQGGESKGHPAHDIFILDDNKDVFEDSTGKKVFAVSMVNGVVFTKHSTWVTGDFGRGGNYVKIFDPETEAMFYYSHLDSVFVEVGQVVSAGEPIGYVGRTGRKALNGKTHIHIAYYKIEDGEPVPEKIIKDLYKAEKRAR